MLEVKESKIFGLGCYTLAHIDKRRKIGEYTGELIEGKRRIEKRVTQQAEDGAIKVIWIGDALAIDAANGGNATAYINHSCAPNAFMRAAPGNRVLFFALRDIGAGEEITIDYRDSEHPPASDCQCGADNCRARANDDSK